MEQNKIGQLTELQANGGGNFITENFPVARHTFHSARMLTQGDSADRWREVTAAQRLAIEREEADRAEAEAGLVAEAEALGAVYDRTSGLFGLNGLTDITAEEMREIMRFGVTRYPTPARIGLRCRTNILVPPVNSYQVSMWRVDLTTLAATCKAEVIAIADSDDKVTQARDCGGIFYNTPYLRRVIGVLDVYYQSNQSIFSTTSWCHNCGVETLKISRISSNFNASQMKNISLESLRFWVDNRQGISPAYTFTLHADAFGRLTDGVGAVDDILPLNLAAPVADADSAGLQIRDGVATITRRAGNDFAFYIPLHRSVKLYSGLKLTVSFDAEGVTENDQYGFALTDFDYSSRRLLKNGRVAITATVASGKTGHLARICLDDYNAAGLDLSVDTPIVLKNFKVEFGENSETAYTPMISELADEALADAFARREILDLAAAKQVTFASV